MDDSELSKWIDYLKRPNAVLTAYSVPEMLEMALEVRRLRIEVGALAVAMGAASEWLGAWSKGSRQQIKENII